MNMQPHNLIDRFGRRIEYLRLSVTDRCDLRCSYCLPKGFRGFEEPDHWLRFDEIERLVALFARFGVSRVRLTGGEPLLRSGLAVLAGRLTAIPGVADLSLSTNGTQLAKHAQALERAGVGRINVSLDSLQRERLARITGRDCLDEVMAGLHAAREAGLRPIKINMVLMQGINDDEVDAMVAFCMAHGFVLRLIEIMPVGDTGRTSAYVDLQPVRRRLQERFGLIDGVQPGGGPARYLRNHDGSFALGFITPLSQHFCETCNRLRVGVDGTLYTCLGEEGGVSLRPLLRDKAPDEVLEAAIRSALDSKPARHEFREKPRKVMRFMAMTGG
ncbi:GTP 3',8-cyclase MoaA [Thermithiobacillus plumbiphilus]|uniref:GTP 3',8-cyclase n=1 Tax=Thermithiobacillus plumbiphilus TaxID=1729899 RepID=A0ABU9D8G8_9PROT